MPDINPPSISPSAGELHSASDPSATDALAHLARMSGTGSSFGQADYVALNTLAIATLLLGVASGLALALNLFLFIPVAGIVCGLISVRKIRHSNGTQGGMPFALAGIVLSLGLGGLAGGREVSNAMRLRADTARVGDVISHFGDLIRDGQYDQAYDNLMTADFRQHFSRKLFTDRFHAMQVDPDFKNHTGGYGHLNSIKWNGKRMFVEPINDNYTRFTAAVLMDFRALHEPGQEAFQLNNMDGDWRISAIPHVFSEKGSPNNPEGK